MDDPASIVKVGQKVWVHVTEVDAKRKRIALSMKGEGLISAKKTTPKKEEAAYDPGDMKSALNALKSKFGK